MSLSHVLFNKSLPTLFPNTFFYCTVATPTVRLKTKKGTRWTAAATGLYRVEVPVIDRIMTNGRPRALLRRTFAFPSANSIKLTPPIKRWNKFLLKHAAGKWCIQTINVPFTYLFGLLPTFWSLQQLDARDIAGQVNTRVHSVCSGSAPRALRLRLLKLLRALSFCGLLFVHLKTNLSLAKEQQM